jgi:hypothetical protein
MSGPEQSSVLPAIVLEPWQGRSDAEWQGAPAGQWTPAQIVEHLAIGIRFSAEKFEERRDRPAMRRRPRSFIERLAGVSILGLGWYPQGFKAPEGTIPPAHVTRAAAEAHFRDGVAKWAALERELFARRPRDLFVKHPRLGDLTMSEWLRFHMVHARHHARQIKQRIGG